MKKTQLLSLVALTVCNGSLFAEDKSLTSLVHEVEHAVQAEVAHVAANVQHVVELVVELAEAVQDVAAVQEQIARYEGVKSVKAVEGTNTLEVIVEEASAEAVQAELAKCESVAKCGCNKPPRP